MLEKVNTKGHEISKVALLRDALMNARERLVAAVAEGLHDEFLAPLRKRVADLLQQIERLNVVHRNRR
jgi:hypothetical protein